MTIIALEPIVTSPRDNLLVDIMMLLDDAANSKQPIGVLELSESIVSLVDDLMDI